MMMMEEYSVFILEKATATTTTTTTTLYRYSAQAPILIYLYTHEEAISKLHVIDANIFATDEDDGTIKLWDLRMKNENQNSPDEDSALRTMPTMYTGIVSPKNWIMNYTQNNVHFRFNLDTCRAFCFLMGYSKS
uniref:WD_REPEATS_REGION domain-containing protein n=1 Tax=Glossina brevipalpis TaxID=37001 RepID=A0A1A9WJ19_9MUSC